MSSPLSALPARLHDDSALVSLVGRHHAVIAVPEAARAIVVAALTARSTRRPVVVAVPTTQEAERLVNDLSAFLGSDNVVLFPAWEILPFERVSPSTDTMGKRLEILWRLESADECPEVVVAPVRAIVQTMGPHGSEADPIIVKPGDVIDPGQLIERLVERGYHREFQVEHRGEVAVRGGIVDVFPSTADVPIRIDMWGDDVDRLTEFSVADQRSTVDRDEVRLFPARELLVTPDVREKAERLIALEP